MPLKHCDYTHKGVLSMVVLGLFLCGRVTAQDHSAHTQEKPATLMRGWHPSGLAEDLKHSAKCQSAALRLSYRGESR